MKPKIKDVTNVEYFMKGARGFVYTGVYKGKKVAIKIKNPESDAIARIENEINFLTILNKYNIGPKLFLSGNKYFVYEFQEGEFMIHWMKTASLEQKMKVLRKLMDQCFIMDKLGINKEEMMRPFKNVVIKKRNIPVLIDFERCHYTQKPKNVTQLLQYMWKQRLIEKDFIDLIQEYKKDVSEKNYKKIIKKVF
ncbi:hypothetical protein KY334_02055 [Candidatus Woesearchaeota archaeon]|nr:hypothetical protein [Candidatus Woesearchaeota archaeon]